MKELVHVDGVLVLQSIHHGVQHDEGARTTYTSTAVNQQRYLGILLVLLLYSADETDERGSKLWYSVIGPGGEVIVCDVQCLCALISRLCE